MSTHKADWSDVADVYLTFLQSEDDQLRRALLDPIMLDLLEPRGKTILDLGCGEGYFARALKAADAARVVGVDIAPELIKKAREKDAPGEYHVYDICAGSPFSAVTFDGACAHMVMMDVCDIDAAYAGLAKCLAPAGRLVVSVVNPYYAFPVGQWSPATDQHRVGRYVYNLLYVTEYFGSRTAQKNLSNSTRTVPHFHRQLQDYINIAGKHGLALDGLFEPPITPELHERFAKLNLAQALARVPLFLIMTFRKAPTAVGAAPSVADAIQKDFARSTAHHARTNSQFYAQYQITLQDPRRAAERETLVAQLNALTAEVAAMRASTSWRLTAPLRRIKRVFRR